MKIFCGKIGKSILFNPDSWGVTGGDNEAPKYYENLFHRNPNDTFYLLGLSDFNRLKSTDKMRINKHGNVIDIWSGFQEWRKSNRNIPDIDANMTYMNYWLETTETVFDTGVIFAGPTGTSNVNGKTTLMSEPSKLSSPLEMLARYAGPLFSFLNDYKPPYALVVNDPRYFKSNARDWFHMPSVVLSQYDEIVEQKMKLSYTSGDCKTVNIPAKYTGVETMFLIGQEKGKPAISGGTISNDLDSFFDDPSDAEQQTDQKDIEFMIVLNEGRPSRYPILKKAILDDVKDVEIYGKWDPETIGNDSRFKGSLKFADLQKMLPRVKYTFCIPIKKGWVTSKFWEMAHYGIIPFLHSTYDDQNNLKAPDFLKVPNSKELFKRIKFLNENPKAYDMLRKTLDDMLLDSYYDGSYLNDLTMNALKEIVS